MRRLAAAALAAAALLRPASSECSKHIRFGTFDEANPYAALAPSQWLDDDEVCWVYYRQLSGGRAVAHLDSGELDVAMLGSTPYATAVARGAALTARRLTRGECSGTGSAAAAAAGGGKRGGMRGGGRKARARERAPRAERVLSERRPRRGALAAPASEEESA